MGCRSICWPILHFAKSSDRQSEIAIVREHGHLGPIGRFPQRDLMRYPIAQRAAVDTLAALERSWNANEFHIHRFGPGSYNGVSMTTHIDKGQVRGQLRI